MHLNTGSLWQNEEQIELSDAELKMVQGGLGTTHKCTYGNYNDGNDCGGYDGSYGNDYSCNYSNTYGNYGGAYLNGYSDASSCDGSQGGFVIMQVVPSSSCYNPCG